MSKWRWCARTVQCSSEVNNKKTLRDCCCCWAFCFAHLVCDFQFYHCYNFQNVWKSISRIHFIYSNDNVYLSIFEWNGLSSIFIGAVWVSLFGLFNTSILQCIDIENWASTTPFTHSMFHASSSSSSSSSIWW